MSKFDCCICFENGLQIIMCRLPCQHKICLDCLCNLDIEKYICPLCRINFSDLVHNKISKKIFDIRNNYQFPPL